MDCSCSIKEDDSWLPSSDYCYVFWAVESCLAYRGVKNIVEQLGLHKAFKLTQILAWLPKVFQHFHTQLLDIPNHVVTMI